MKISAQDEYGLRILIRIAQSGQEEGLSIPQLSEQEGMSASYVGKLTRLLRMAGYIESTRGQKGGYILAMPPEEINIGEVLHALGGALFDRSFCDKHAAGFKLCTNSVDCSVRSLWSVVQSAIDHVLSQVSLKDLLSTEQQSDAALQAILMQMQN
ncbi:RrF2 family transcriptional regulator [Phaeodactylibacter luteus]|uniref:Rrf2 family transcriptional regulator n=1 Tax=Phaeodactylibacter luteus TaxID=1564516 RepID=A0A5C6S3L4_9BACT|nr:Rrf2 family transcriptional regulator [Phaeodactylibacter luteus]TXB69428.1 Rrf2 family transcriptional regulator [Phaeodactylibacter luteus]